MIMDFCGCQTCYDKNKFKEISLDNIENMYQYFRYAYVKYAGINGAHIIIIMNINALIVMNQIK